MTSLPLIQLLEHELGDLAQIAQYADGIGPCMHALNTGDVVQIDDLASDERWGVYRSDAFAHGLRSSLSMPIGSNGHIVGALNLYSTEPRTFTAEHRRRAARFADRAAGALSVAARIPTASASSLWLPSARVCSDSRTSQIGSDPPAATKRSSKARLTARDARVRTRPIGCCGAVTTIILADP